jgi:hypothetical protein
MTDPHHLFGQPDLYTGIPIPFKGVNEMLRDLFSRWPVIKQIKNGGNGTGVEAMSERSYGNSGLDENVSTLPHHFAASGVNSAVSILELMGHNNKSLNNLGMAASLFEVYEGIALETRRTRANEPVHKGRSGAIVRAGGALSGPVPLVLRLLYAITANNAFRRAASWSSLGGSLLTRYGWIDAGHASAKDHRIPLMLDEAAPEIRKSSHELVVDRKVDRKDEKIAG